jgi:hypothetical protein
VIILKTFGLCLALAMLVVVLVLPPWHTDDNLTGRMHTSVQRSLGNIPSLPVSIAYSMIESAVSLVVEPSLVLELLETEAYSPTQEEQI